MINTEWNLLALAKNVKQSLGKGYLSQLADIVTLRVATGELGASDYYQYELFDDARFPMHAKLEFLGWRGQTKIDRTLNDSRWHFCHSDKVISTLLLERMEVPVARILAVFDLREREIPGIRHLKAKSDLASFLEKAAFPIFAKPVDNALGRRTMLIEGYDEHSRTLALRGGKEISLDDAFEEALAEAKEGRGGLMYQDLLGPHPELAKVCGERLSTIRMITIDHPTPILTHAVIKFPTGSNVADNFRGGGGGNMVGRVGLDSGIVEAVFSLRNGRYVPVTHHPDTGNSLIGFRIPEWESYRNLVRRVSTCFRGMKLQHWDIAIAKNGPVILELNGDGCVQLPQIAYQRGILGGDIREAYSEAVIARRRSRLWRFLFPIQEPLTSA